jgi:carbamoylphosphate synthase large subunit
MEAIMKSWFCSNTDGLDATIKTAVYAAGYLIGKNNKDKATAILLVAMATKTAVESGTDNGALNAILREEITALVPLVSNDPVIEASIAGVLSSLNISVTDSVFPTFTNAVIKDLVNSFVSGLQAGIA